MSDNNNNIINIIKERNEKLNKEQNDFNNEFGIKKDNDVTELQMHKILYFTYAYFWDKFKKDLFSPSFEAWRFGPVEINYRSEKTIKDMIEINDNEKDFLIKTIDKLLVYNVWYLVEQSHLTNPWKKNYKKNKKIKISNDDIKNLFP